LSGGSSERTNKIRASSSRRTEALTPAQLAIVAPFPFIVWGADEIRRLLIRRYRTGRHGASTV
jgi:hypothetical protein